MIVSTSITSNIYDGIQNYKKKHLLPLLIVGPLLDSLFFYIQVQISFRRPEIILESDSNQFLLDLYMLFGIQVIQILINLLFNNWLRSFIIENLKQHYQGFYIKLLHEANPYWLSSQNTKEIYKNFEKGSNTLVDIILFSFDTIKSCLSILLSLILIWKELGKRNICSVIILVSIVYLSYQIEEINKTNNNNLRKKNKKYHDTNASMSKNIYISLINGNGDRVIDFIRNNQNQIITSNNKIRYQYIFNKEILKLLEISLKLGIMVYFSSFLNCAQLVTFENVFSRIKREVGKPLDIYRNLCKKLLGWFELQEKLEKIVLDDINSKNKVIMREFDINMIISNPQLKIPKSPEYRVIGPSGSGKSTWITSALCQLKSTYKSNWFYLDQNMDVNQDKYTTIYEYFQMYLLNKQNISFLKKEIIKYSKILGLDKIINESKIDQPFQNPSGGEIKRICILQKFIPILLGEICPQVIFTDEISSGLDEQNFLKVRELMEYIKEKYQIVFIVVEHREYDCETKLINLEVKKELEIDPDYVFHYSVSKEKKSYIDELFSSFNLESKKEKETEITCPPKISVHRFKVVPESHRLATTLHRRRINRSHLKRDRNNPNGLELQNSSLIPQLARVKGLTQSRQKALIDHLGEFPEMEKRIHQESDLLAVAGIGKILAKRIFIALRKTYGNGKNNQNRKKSI